MLRPQPARWFEVLVAHDDAPAALAALAGTGAIELETRPAEALREPLSELHSLFEQYHALARRYRAYWPAPRARREIAVLPAGETLRRALGRLSMWHATAAPLIETLQALEREAAELDTWRELLTALRAHPLDLGLLTQDGEVLARRLYIFSAPPTLDPPAGGLLLDLPLRGETALLAIAPHAAMATFHRQAIALHGRELALPRWFQGRAGDNLTLLERRLRRARHGIERVRGALARVGDAAGLPAALDEIERLRWFAEQVPKLAGSEHFAWLSGWTAARPEALRAALTAASARALVRFPEPPQELVAPLILRNPWWARPFELFARALGVPGRTEVDPSPLLAFVVPLLFGYMFADVGQGAVLLLLGLALSKRYPVTRLLVAGGVSAMAFGFVFGGLFSHEHVVPVLWFHPLDAPLTLLGVPLAFGAVLIALGQLLNGLEAYWRGAAWRWLLTDAGLLTAYVAAGLGSWRPAWFWLAGAGFGWYLLGHGLAERRAAAVPAALGTLLEQAFQLAVNTLSFVRVGAFALAHAGLSSAIVALAVAVDHPFVAIVIFVVGNLIVIVLEALVVSIQVTRLMLFEFFIRFLRGEGRPFRPLLAPPSTQARSRA